MIPTMAEIRRGLEGALAILRRDPDAMERFDLSLEGFWRSFGAILVAGPAYALVVVERLAETGLPAALPLVLVVEAASYVLGWLAFPLAAAGVLHLLGESRRFVPLVVAGNWAAILQVGVFVSAMLLGWVLPEGLGRALVQVAVLAALAYQWLVIRTALQAPGAIAAGFVLLDIVTSLTVARASDRLLAWLGGS